MPFQAARGFSCEARGWAACGRDSKNPASEADCAVSADVAMVTSGATRSPAVHGPAHGDLPPNGGIRGRGHHTPGKTREQPAHAPSFSRTAPTR